MEKDIIGAILKNRIKEMGMTQEEFAQEAGIGISSLKKYMNGTNAYSYELMERFSQILNCSYDYLLGYTQSANREIQGAKELLKLSDKSLEKIAAYAIKSDELPEAKRFIDALDAIISNEGLVYAFADYFLDSQYSNNVLKQIYDIVEDTTITHLMNQFGLSKDIASDMIYLKYDKMQLIALVMTLEQAKREHTEMLEELKKRLPLDELEKRLTTATANSQEVNKRND